MTTIVCKDLEDTTDFIGNFCDGLKNISNENVIIFDFEQILNHSVNYFIKFAELMQDHIEVKDDKLVYKSVEVKI